eukprot:362745-Chlamydomonas_euryale.AAC.2
MTEVGGERAYMLFCTLWHIIKCPSQGAHPGPSWPWASPQPDRPQDQWSCKTGQLGCSAALDECGSSVNTLAHADFYCFHCSVHVEASMALHT